MDVLAQKSRVGFPVNRQVTPHIYAPDAVLPRPLPCDGRASVDGGILDRTAFGSHQVNM